MALGFIAGPGYLETAASHPDFADGHLVLRQRSTFIGADDRNVSKCFDHIQPFCQNAARGKALDSHCQRKCQSGWQAFRCHCDERTERKQDCIREVLTYMRFERSKRPDSPPDDDRNQGQPPTEMPQFFLEHGGLILHGLCQLRNAPKLR